MRTSPEPPKNGSLRKSEATLQWCALFEDDFARSRLSTMVIQQPELVTTPFGQVVEAKVTPLNVAPEVFDPVRLA